MPLRAANARSFNRGGAARNRPYTPILTKLNVSAGAAFSVGKVNAGYFGPCKNVRRSSDNAQADIWFVRGRLDQGAFGAFIGAGSGFCAKDYDQSGNGRDASQSTAASQPQLVQNLIGGRPALKFSGAQSLSTASFLSQTVTESINAAMGRTGAVTTQQNTLTAVNLVLGFASSANNAFLSVSAIMTETAADNVVHSITGVVNGAASVINVDGTQAAGTQTLGSGASGAFVIGGASLPFTGNMGEVILLPATVLSSPEQDILRAYQRSEYGTP